MEIFKTKVKVWSPTILTRNSIFDIVGVLDPPAALVQNVFTKRHKHRPIVSILTSIIAMFVE